MTIISGLKELPVLDLRYQATAHAMYGIRSVLLRMEQRALQWIRRTDFRYSKSFGLPLQEVLRREIRSFFSDAYVSGRGKGVVVDRVWVKADLLTNKIIDDIENELRLGWARYNGDRKLVDYHTRLVFARAGGWEMPHA